MSETRTVSRPAPKRAQEIAEAIGAEIVRLGWPVGQSLGTQDELRERHGVSRAVLREAFRLVESQGSAVMRRGGSGGLIVARPAPAAAASTLVTYLDIIGVTSEEVLEARLVLEAEMVAQATERLTAERAQSLRRLVDQLQAAKDRQAPSTELRNVLAQTTQNTVLELFIQTLTQLAGVRRKRFARGVRFRDLYPDEFDADATRAADALSEATEHIIAGDVGEAQRILRQDMLTRHEFTEGLIRRHGGKELEQARIAKIRLGSGPFASHLAVEIAEDIAIQGLASGERLGAEPQLIANYGVSRAIFREAVRLLELHGLVYTQRGNRGGLFIGRADPSYAIGSAVSSLRSVKPSAGELLEVARPLAMSTIRLALRHRGQGRVAPSPALASPMASAPWSEGLKLAQGLLAAADNRVTELLLGVLMEFLPQQRGGLSAARLDELEAGRKDLLEALDGGDASIALRTAMDIFQQIRRIIDEAA